MTEDVASAPKLAVVTGATGGMGREIVAELSRDHTVIAQGRNAEALAELTERYGAIAWQTDLVASLEENMADIFTVSGLTPQTPIDVLVHGAAVALPLSVAQATAGHWRAAMNLNVHVPAVLSSVLLPGLRAAGGTVIFINSGAGKISYPDNTVYAATKHALYAVADGLRQKEHDIRVSTVAPGPTDTAMLRGLQDYNPEHVIAPREIARAIRAVVDTGPTAQLTDVVVRPRLELSQRS